MKEDRLLERLKFVEQNPDYRQGHDPAREVRSIIGHINHILNTRQGSCEIHEDFGIPDFMNVPGTGLTDTAKKLEASIETVIAKYEPRVASVKVIFEPAENDYLNLKFRLEATLASKASEKIVLETVVSSDGLVRVSE